MVLVTCDSQCGVCGVSDTTNCTDWKLFASTWTSSGNLTSEGWETEGVSNVVGTDCAGVSLFGGFNQLKRGAILDKTYFGIIPHSRARI